MSLTDERIDEIVITIPDGDRMGYDFARAIERLATISALESAWSDVNELVGYANHRKGDGIDTMLNGVILATNIIRSRIDSFEIDQSKACEQPADVKAPVGYVLVPKEPTQAMLNAAWEYHGSFAYTRDARPDSETDAECYRAMIAAAPQPDRVADVKAEPVYQHKNIGPGWSDVSKSHYDASSPSHRRVLYAAPQPAPEVKS